MPKRLTPHSALPLAVAALVTFGFVGCAGETRSLNTVPAGNGGEEGDNPASGSGGKAGSGTSGSTHAGNSGMGTGGRSEVGGASMVTPLGGSSFGGLGALAGVPNGGSSGSPNGGVPNAGAGAMAGYSGGFSGSGPMAGSGGGAGAPYCVVARLGTGCDDASFCVDDIDSCWPDQSDACPGKCAAPYLEPACDGSLAGPVECPRDFECLPDTDSALSPEPFSLCVGGRSPECAGSGECGVGFSCLDTPDGRRCVPDRANCLPLDTCDSGIPTCPPGYAPADAQACDYVCVPFQHCGCKKDSECPQQAVCDRALGRCVAPLAPAPRCREAIGQALEPGVPASCADMPRVSGYGFVEGECKATTYGACETTGNRFSTMEECLSTCQGMPIEQSCRGTRKAAEGCLACGGGGGCMLWGQFCFEPCESNDDCAGSPPGYFCVAGICQVGGCI